MDAPSERVWEFIAEPSNFHRHLPSITRWDVEGERANGLGARHSMRMRVGSAEVGGLIEIVEWDPPCDVAWNSVTGLDQRLRFRLREREGRTTVTLRLSYAAPGGLLATLSERFSGPLVRQNLRGILAQVKHQVEGTDLGPNPAELAPSRLEWVGHQVGSVRVLAEAGLIRPIRPDRLARTLLALNRWGPSPAAGYEASAVRYPNDPAVIDDRGTVTFEQVHLRTNAIAHAFRAEGIGEGDGVAIMCRNHRYFVDATLSVSKLGANALYLNTGFAGPQLAEVVKREKPKAIVYDQEFEGLLRGATRRKRFIAWHENGTGRIPTLDALVATGDPSPVDPPEEPGRVVILTSGTTGTPKGAARKPPESIEPALSMLDRIPLKARGVTLIAAPLFHSWGFAHFTIGLLLSSTYVLQRKFDPERVLEGIQRHQATAVPMVPVMLQRIMELPPEVRRRYDTSSLRAVPVSGSALPGDLARRFMDEFGDVVYNLYGSTEVAWATIAGPEDLKAAPGTAGRPPRGTILRILDERGSELPVGEPGRIFVANEMLFEGYTGGGSKDIVNGLMSTGDVGFLDEAGRLFVSGRDDDMIVSGGENVFPREIEDLLANHAAVAEAAVIGIDDEKFGQRLKAYVVKKPKAKLTEAAVKGYVKENLANYKVPREVEFIKELPRNPTGKVLKRELLHQAG